MLHIDIPGAAPLVLEHLVLDFNGTLACDGTLLDGVAERLTRLSAQLTIHVVTGDIHGKATAQLDGLPCHLTVLPPLGQSEAKRAYVDKLGRSHCACIGNGRNDWLMLEVAALAIAVVEAEGIAPATLAAADVATRGVLDALDLLLQPLRLMATLRT